MAETPASRTPYEVLGVAATATPEEVKRAYRRMLRETHPDTGGSALRFHEVQIAWQRIGTAADRQAYDSGVTAAWATASATTAASTSGSASGPRTARGAGPRAQTASAVRARSYGYPGGLSRERYVVLMREWIGRGTGVDDLFDPKLVQAAPREVRRQLAKALAEEATWSRAVQLGIGYTIWNDLDPGPRADGKVDHVVLGPGGLFALLSDDWGSPVRVLRGEIVGDGVPAGEQPLQSLERRARALAKSLRVAFTAVLVVVPDEALEEQVVNAGRGRRTSSALVRRSSLAGVLRDGLEEGHARTSPDRMFELRTQIQERARFV